MSLESQEIIHEFLIESSENLARLDLEMVELERRPKDASLLASIFRIIHTIKGTCGFLGFTTLEAVTHIGESILSQVRDGQRDPEPELVSLILEMVDAVKKVLTIIEATGEEGEDRHLDLQRRLQAACDGVPPSSPSPLPAAEPGPEIAISADNGNAVVKRGPPVADSTIRVDVVLLDKLMNLVGELVLARNQILQFSTRQEDAPFNATSQRLNLITSELQESVMKTRMQPIGMVWNKLPRVVHDLAASCGKQIQLEMDGAGTELDKTIIEAIKDPLTHIVRNCCDHGIETPEQRVRVGKPAQGRLLLRAFHEGGHVNIEVSDDGAGIDAQRVRAKAIQKNLIRGEHAERMAEREILNLVFQPGFSTAEQISAVSGRGVGMDVVKTNIEKIGGIVDLASRAGQGTTVKIRIPLTLAIIPGLVISCGSERFVIPQVSLLELVRLEGEAGRKLIESIHGTPVYRRRGNLLPLAYLNRVLNIHNRAPLPPEAGNSEAISIVILQADDRQFGLVVDGINDTQEIVVKPLGKQLKGISAYAGATIMGDGKVALILDVLGIAQLSGVLAESREQTRAAAEQKTERGIEQQRLLLFRAGSFERLAVPLSLVARLEEFPQSAIERAGGGQVVQYRNRILPLVLLQSVLESGAAVREQVPGPLQVVVFNDADRSVGVIVDQILDVAEEAVTVRQRSSRKGLLGSAVVGARVTDLLDLNHVLHAAAQDWFQDASGTANGKRILVAEASAFARGMIRSGLDMAGYRVLEAANLDEAIRSLERLPVDVVMAALDLPPHGSSALRAAMRRRPDWEGIPMLALAESTEQVHARAGQPAEFQDCQLKFDQEAMLASVARLASALAEAGPGWAESDVVGTEKKR